MHARLHVFTHWQFGEMVSTIVCLFESEPAELEQQMQALGLRHVDYGARAEHFPLIKAALLDTVEHIPDELGVLQECARVLKPGGKLIVTVPAFMSLWSYNDEINAHQRRYTVPELRQKIELYGLAVKRISYNNFFLFPAIAGIRLLRPYNPGLKSPHLDAAPEVYQVDMEPIPEPANSVLHAVGRLEAELLGWGTLPFGTSVIAIAEKKE